MHQVNMTSNDDILSLTASVRGDLTLRIYFF